MKHLRSLRAKFERFCLKHRNKGIPNLMLYIALGNALVTILSMFNGGAYLYNLLCFDKTSILQGQVWRLITYIFTDSGTSPLALLFLYFYYMLGRHIEQNMGTFRFNLFYFSGVVMMDVFAMLFAPAFTDGISQAQLDYWRPVLLEYGSMAGYLHLSLMLVFATAYPDSHFMILMIIPVKAWVIGLLNLILTGASIFNLSFPTMYFPHNLFPLVALGNYLLFTGKDIVNLLPLGIRMKLRRKPSKKTHKEERTGTIPFGKKAADTPKNSAPYTHRCTVCGRTDISDPELEFRYCSRCSGYHCYCQDHINNHSHIE